MDLEAGVHEVLLTSFPQVRTSLILLLLALSLGLIKYPADLVDNHFFPKGPQLIWIELAVSRLRYRGRLSWLLLPLYVRSDGINQRRLVQALVL